MKKLLFLVSILLFVSCNQQPSVECQTLETANAQIEKDIKTYKTVWDKVFLERDINLIDSESFDENVTVVTATGNVTGIDSFKGYYNNYLTGFSDAEFTFVNIFGQGDNIVKHWNFKGTHDGEMFGIPATGNKVDISGTTIVKMKDGKVYQEQDFFDNHSFLSQLGLL
jgi:steroid delta-isomerase-like uncharacterized protein|tara:strand:- start:555 stop:1058 length:504 start_codon:yes stop_codon:yes gene_type:complete